VISAQTRRKLAHDLVNHELSERQSLAIVGTSASAYRYETRPDRNIETAVHRGVGTSS